MDVEFGDNDLDRLETDPSFTMGLDQAIVKAYRKRLQIIRAAPDERDFYNLKSWHFEKLEGKRQHQHSIRLNDQFRLIVEFVGTGRVKRVRVVGIEDYH
ncbi:MAG TPA: type II toxin-antitoxin system RelE/ParE family toxin [Chloroflexota bacterium]|nr:type II toxin-antitoxin system RelE/ParE family toxin [Chloroflexota bacterium]